MKIICGFPGIGKTTFKKLSEQLDYRVLDSDSSLFSWRDFEANIRSPLFPDNYLEHIAAIKERGEADYLLTSTHSSVIEGLIARRIDFGLAYPERGLKAEYLHRYQQRGNDEAFLERMARDWQTFHDQLEAYPVPRHRRLILRAGQYLSDTFFEGGKNTWKNLLVTADSYQKEESYTWEESYLCLPFREEDNSPPKSNRKSSP